MKKRYPLLCLLFSAGVTALYGQISLNTLNAPYEQDFNTLGTAASNESSTLPAGWSFLETGTNANTTYGAGTGSSNTGNTYSFGSDAGDRAFGGLLSGSLTPTIGAGFINQTGTTVTSLAITYHGEQWRLGAAGRGSDRLDFEFSTDATSLASGTWIPVDALDFSSPETTGTVRALNGNLQANSATVTFTIDGLNIANGATFFIRWSDFNVSNAWHKVDYGTDYITEPAAEDDKLTVTVPAGSDEAQFTITALTDRKRELPWELVSFYLTGTSDGLVAAQPRLFAFTIIDVRSKPHFVVFPNPTPGFIKLTCEELDDDETFGVELRNPQGEVLLRKHGTRDELETAISRKLQNGRKGIYALKVTIDEESQLIRIVRN